MAQYSQVKTEDKSVCPECGTVLTRYICRYNNNEPYNQWFDETGKPEAADHEHYVED